MSTAPARNIVAGRPRGFVPQQALHAAMEVFWLRGYEAATLDDLTAAMGLSRSSFYACFTSKRALLIEALQRYADQIFAALVTIARGEREGKAAVQAILTEIADPKGGVRGCFFVNTVCELGPHDNAVAGLAQAHIGRVTGLVTDLIIAAGAAPEIAAARAGAMLAIAIGATSLRKAGASPSQIETLLRQAEILFPV